MDELLSVSEVRSEPGKGSAGDVIGGLKVGEEDRVVNSVKGCREVEKDEDV